MLTFKHFLKEAYPRQKRGDKYYYHLTQGKNMTGISKKGLSTKPGHGRTYSFSKRKSLYLASTPKGALQFAQGMAWKGRRRNSLRLVRIDKSKLDPSKFHRDKNMAYNDEEHPHKPPGTWEYHGDIPAKDIEFSGGKHYKKTSKKWERLVGSSWQI